MTPGDFEAFAAFHGSYAEAEDSTYALSRAVRVARAVERIKPMLLRRFVRWLEQTLLYCVYRLRPHDLEVRYALARLRLVQRDWVDALRWVDEADRLTVSISPGLAVLAGLASGLQGDTTACREWFEDAAARAAELARYNEHDVDFAKDVFSVLEDEPALATEGEFGAVLDLAYESLGDILPSRNALLAAPGDYAFRPPSPP